MSVLIRSVSIELLGGLGLVFDDCVDFNPHLRRDRLRRWLFTPRASSVQLSRSGSGLMLQRRASANLRSAICWIRQHQDLTVA